MTSGFFPDPSQFGGPSSNLEWRGDSGQFESVEARDEFFSLAENYSRLARNYCIFVNTGNDIITAYTWEGADAPSAYNNNFWFTASLQVSPASVNVGSRRDSNSGNSAQWINTATLEHHIYINEMVPLDLEESSGDLLRYKLDPRGIFYNQTTLSNVVSTPDGDGVTRYVLPNGSSGRNESFSAIPAEAGDFTLEIRFADFVSQPIFKQRVSFTADDAAVATVTGITQAAQAVVTFDAPHTYQIGDSAVIDQIGGMVELNNIPSDVVAVTITTITIDTDTTTFTAYTDSGVGYKEIFTDLDNPLMLLNPGQLLYVSLVPAPNNTMSFRGGDFGVFIPYLRAKSRHVNLTAVTDIDNVVPQIEAKVGDDRLDYFSLKNIPTRVFLNELAEQTTNADYTTAPVVFTSHNIDTIAGEHKITLSFECAANVTGARVVLGLFIDGVLIDSEIRSEMKDTNNNIYYSKIINHTFTAASHTIRVDFGRGGGGLGANVSAKNLRIVVES